MFSEEIIRNSVAFRLTCEYRKLKIQELIDSGEWYDPLHGI